MTTPTMREALEPFAKLRPPESAPDDAVLVLATMNGGIIDVRETVTAGAIRRAQAALSASSPDTVAVRKELLAWLGDSLELLGELPRGPYNALTKYGEPQSKTWKCDGCDGTDTEYWPRWELSDEKREFKHTPGCKWVEFRSLLTGVRTA